jgi:cobalt-zinc-cadmium efflux system membrane fusion protein
MKFKYIIIIVSIAFLSCNTNIEEIENKEVKTTTNIVNFTDDQIKVAEIKIGTLDTIKLSKEIISTGVVEADPNKLARVSVPLASFIEKINVHHGDFVSKGNTILFLKHADFVDLQSSYVKSKSELEYLTKEYLRNENLFKENAISEKQFNAIKSEYNSLLIENKSLEQKLILLGLDPKLITANNISSIITLKAPISGYVDEIYVSLGQFVEPKDVLFEMVDPSGFQVMLKIYSKYKHQIKKGQKLKFRNCDINCKDLYATITSVGQLINNETKTFKVHAKPDSVYTELTTGAFINSRIMVNNSKVPALLSNAIITNSNGSFVFIQKTKNTFEQKEIKIGERNDLYIEILNAESIKGEKIVINGANYLYSYLNQ